MHEKVELSGITKQIMPGPSGDLEEWQTLKVNVTLGFTSGDIDLLGLPFLKVTLEPRHYLYIIIPPYANKLNCAISLVKNKEIGYNSLHYCPWVRVHFALGTTVLITSISLGIHVHIDTVGLYFKQIITRSNQYGNTNNKCY